MITLTPAFLNTLNVTEYQKELFFLMKFTEQISLPSQDFFFQSSINSRARGTVIDWLVQVHSKFHYHLPCLYLAVFFLDSMLLKIDLVPEDYQLLAATSLFLAAKIEEQNPPPIRNLIHDTQNDFTKEDMIEVEKTITTTLDYHLNPILIPHYLSMFLTFMHANQKEANMTYFICEASLLNEEYISIKPSQIAAAAVCLSITLIRDSVQCTPDFEQYAGYSKEVLQECAQMLLENCISIATSRFQAIRRKYAKTEMESVSLFQFPEIINI